MDFVAFPVDDESPDVECGGPLFCKEVIVQGGQLPSVVEWENETREIPAKSRGFYRCVQDGETAEARFRTLAQRRGFELLPTTEGDDYFTRVDVAMRKDGGICLVDIKARRKVARGDKGFQSEYTWLELHKSGSLYTGKSQVLAIEIDDGFVLLDKARIREWIAKTFSSSQRRVERASQALMKPYRRSGKYPEWITMASVRELAREAGVEVWVE